MIPVADMETSWKSTCLDARKKIPVRRRARTDNTSERIAIRSSIRSLCAALSRDGMISIGSAVGLIFLLVLAAV
jgi:hypothetical protein